MLLTYYKSIYINFKHVLWLGFEDFIHTHAITYIMDFIHVLEKK